MFDRDHSLYILARGYAAGTLSCLDSEAFEERLAKDQAARDALVTVVGHLDPTISPDAGYRRAVHDRLRPPLWRRLLTPRPYRGHPSLWALAGAAAVLLDVLCWPELTMRKSDASLSALPTPNVESGVGGEETPHPLAESRPGRPAVATADEKSPGTQVVRGARPKPDLLPPMENP